MKHRTTDLPGVWTALAIILFAINRATIASETNTVDQFRQLQEQNEILQNQLHKQQELIDKLTVEVGKIRETNEKNSAAMEQAKDDTGAASSGFSLGKIQITGEGGIGIFESESEGLHPHAEFRVDEAKLFVDAPVLEDVFAFAEINFVTREASDVNLNLGECYLDLEDVSQWLGGPDRLLNARIGRFDIPFGEEYQTRDAIDNPLITASLSDMWGVDEGVELYGSRKTVSYVIAVQNGGVSTTRDFMADKAVVGRISVDPKKWLHFSVSAMRTGDLSAKNDFLSEIWFANGWFRSLGSTNTTKFHANLAEGDITIRIPRGRISAFGGYISYDDDDPAANNRRDVYYYTVEAVHDLPWKFYGAARFSQIFANKGFPLVGDAMRSTYLFGPLTKDLWRLSLGLGRRWNNHLLTKIEYSLEQGKEVGGKTRDHEDLFATEVAFRF